MWPARTIAYFLLFWAGCLLALVNPIWGVINYMMVYQVNPVMTWWGAPLAGMGMRFSMLAVTFTLVGMFTGKRRTPRAIPDISLWEVGLVLLVVVAGLDIIIGIGYGPSSRFTFEKMWKALVFVLILGRLATTRRNIHLVIWAFVAGSMYIGWDAYTAPADAFMHGRLERIGGPDFFRTSGVAAHLSAMLPIIGIAFLIAKDWKLRLAAAVSGAFTVNAIIMCRTRSAFIGLCIGGLAALIMVPKAKRFRIHLALAIGAVCAFSLTDVHYWDRIGTLADKDTFSTDLATVSRTAIWKASLKVMADYPFGVGPGNFPRIIGTYDPICAGRSSHNSVIVAFVELGVQGGALFVSLVIGSVVLLLKSRVLSDRTREPVETKIIAYGLLVSLVTYFVTGIGTQRFYCESYWWVLVLPLCLYRVVRGEIAEMADVPLLATRPVEDEDWLYEPAWI